MWGVGLEPAMEAQALKAGYQVRLQDHSTQPVVVQEVAEDGSIHEKTARRREWSATPVLPEREVAPTTPQGQALATPSHGLVLPEREVAPTTPQGQALVTPGHGLAEQDQDGGMSTD